MNSPSRILWIDELGCDPIADADPDSIVAQLVDAGGHGRFAPSGPGRAALLHALDQAGQGGCLLLDALDQPPRLDASSLLFKASWRSDSVARCADRLAAWFEAFENAPLVLLLTASHTDPATTDAELASTIPRRFVICAGNGPVLGDLGEIPADWIPEALMLLSGRPATRPPDAHNALVGRIIGAIAGNQATNELDEEALVRERLRGLGYLA